MSSEIPQLPDDRPRRDRRIKNPTPIPDTPEMREAYRQHALRRDEVWAGHSVVAIDVWHRAFDGDET